MRILFFIIALSLSGCVITRAYNMPKVQKDTNEFNTKVEKIAAKAQTDFEEKKKLLENLEHAAPPAYSDAASDLKGYFASMEKAMAEVTTERKTMREARADLASLAHGREVVRGNEPEFAAVETAAKAFEASANRLNVILQSYSKSSNKLAKILAEKKLYYHFDVKEFQGRLKKAIKTAQSGVERLNKAIKKGQLSDEEDLALAERYTALAQRLPELSRQLVEAADGRAKVASTDPQWPEVQKVLNEFETLGHQMEELNAEMKAKKGR